MQRPAADIEHDTPLERLAPPDLQRLVLDYIGSRHPDYSALVCASDPDELSCYDHQDLGAGGVLAVAADHADRRRHPQHDALPRHRRKYRAARRRQLSDKLAATAIGEGSIEAALVLITGPSC